MRTPGQEAVGWLTRWASGLRFPTLLAVTAVLFLIDLVVPDFVPFADELMLGLLTLILATLRKARAGASSASPAEPVKDRSDTRQPDR